MAQAVQVLGQPRKETPERWANALQRALNGGVEIFRIAGSGEMVATSSTSLDTVYLVDAHHCGCEAALSGDPVCTHRAAARFVLGLPLGSEAPALVECPECHGGGVIYSRGCEQTGFPHPTCPVCRGSGTQPPQCPDDGGAMLPLPIMRNEERSIEEDVAA